MGRGASVDEALLRNSVTLQPSLHCSLIPFEAHFMRRITELFAVSAT
jgi:hypothetical protein